MYLRLEELKLKDNILNILLHKYNEKLLEIGKNMVLLGKSATKHEEYTLMNCIRNLPKELKVVLKCLM